MKTNTLQRRVQETKFASNRYQTKVKINYIRSNRNKWTPHRGGQDGVHPINWPHFRTKIVGNLLRWERRARVNEGPRGNVIANYPPLPSLMRSVVYCHPVYFGRHYPFRVGRRSNRGGSYTGGGSQPTLEIFFFFNGWKNAHPRRGPVGRVEIPTQIWCPLRGTK